MRILVAIPAYNEAEVIGATLATLHDFLFADLAEHDWRIVVADNGSNDGTADIVREFSKKFPRASCLSLTGRGKGLAIREAWRSADADIYAFMDADLSTSLDAFPELVKAIEVGADIAAGSRFHPSSDVQRSLSRLFVSHGYRVLLQTVFRSGIDDAACGFKAVSRRVVESVLPLVEDEEWFFDTELLLRAAKANMAIAAVPVEWRENRMPARLSKVSPYAVIKKNLRKIIALRKVL